MDRNILRRSIKEHLESNERLIAVAKEVSEKNIPVSNATTIYGIKYFTLKTKIANINFKKEFNKMKPKYEEAVREVLAKCSVYGAYSSAGDKYKISPFILKREVQKARAVGLEEYAFDRKVNFGSRSILTYLEEKSLLDELKKWKKNADCPCSLCALEELTTRAYKYVEKNGKLYLLNWTHEQADIVWLIGFEMRHSDEIHSEFEPYTICSCEIIE